MSFDRRAARWAAWKDQRLKKGEKLVLLAIIELADGRGVAAPGRESLMAMAGFTSVTLPIHIAKLQSYGCISVQAGGRGTGHRTEYTVLSDLDGKESRMENDALHQPQAAS